MHGASAAQRHSATEFRARHSEHVAQYPKKRGVAVDVDGTAHAVNVDRVWHCWCLRASPAAAWMRLAEPAPPIVGGAVIGSRGAASEHFGHFCSGWADAAVRRIKPDFERGPARLGTAACPKTLLV